MKTPFLILLILSISSATAMRAPLRPRLAQRHPVNIAHSATARMSRPQPQRRYSISFDEAAQMGVWHSKSEQKKAVEILQKALLAKSDPEYQTLRQKQRDAMNFAVFQRVAKLEQKAKKYSSYARTCERLAELEKCKHRLSHVSVATLNHSARVFESGDWEDAQEEPSMRLLEKQSAELEHIAKLQKELRSMLPKEDLD